MRVLALTILYITISCHTIAAQWISMDSMKVVQVNLVRGDTAGIFLAFRTAGSGGKEIFFEHTVQDTLIRIRGCYTTNGTTTNTNHNYYIPLGQLKDGTYSVELTVFRSFEDTICTYHDSIKENLTFTVHAPAFVPTVSPQTITFYPNPVQDIIHLNLPTGTTLQKAEIHDMQGRLLRIYSGKAPVNVADLPKGLYLLLVETDNSKYTIKFTKS